MTVGFLLFLLLLFVCLLLFAILLFCKVFDLML